MIGTLLNRRYRIESELGQGGMGIVYRAHDMLLDRDVAVKVLNAAGLGTEGRARLLREARAVAQLNHPNIVSVYDVGEADLASASGTPYVVMELVEGVSVFERSPTDFDAIVSVAKQICAALEHAHARGIVHRDLKPENVIVTSDGSAKLMDFGLARSAASRMTTEGALIGTVHYLAPEQALGKTIDGRADLYALGVMLYEMTTGRVPFDADDPVAIISQHLHASVVPPHTQRPDVPPALEAVILRLLAKDPADRFDSARAVAEALNGASPDRLAGAVAPTRDNLPAQLTSFVGRAKEIEAVKHLFAQARLLTLTGPGGTGKTRLALQVAPDFLESFADGVWLIELASLSDPDLVPQNVASVLGVREQPGYPLTKALVDYLRPRSLLLILDNCEHLIEACATLVETLLLACPQVKVMVTSREALGIGGETIYRVPSLSLPDVRHLPPLESLAAYESIRLFVERAATVRPEFELTAENAATIAQICHRLDGVPLAIELAAARVQAMSVEQIALRLDDRFRLLTGGSRTAMPRQQTLRALIDWSWDLLSDHERQLLRRLSVFLGGWSLAAAEAVGAGEGIEASDVLDLLTRLVEKSLVMLDERGLDARHYLLDTIRQYAREKLLDAGESEQARARHLRVYVDLSEEAEPELRSADQLSWLVRLEAEHDNLRAALKWASSSGDIEAGLRLAGNLTRFWYLRGYWREGREWLNLFLSESADVQAAPESLLRARVTALAGAGWLADENGSEIALYTECLALCRQIGDRWGEAYALRGLVSGASNWGEPENILPRLQESLAVFRELQDAWGTGLALYNMGWLTLGQDGPTQAESTWDESLRLFRRSGDRWGIAVTLGALSYLARLQGNYPRTSALSEESLSLFRELGDKAGIAVSLTRLGNVASRRADYSEAVALINESLVMQRDRGDQQGIIDSLQLLGLVATYQGDYDRARSIFEEGLALTREIDARLDTPNQLSYLALVAYFQNDLDRAAELWQESLALFQAQDYDYGLGGTLHGLGMIAHRRGDYARARTSLEEGLARYRASGDKRAIAAVLHSLGNLAHAQGDAAQALSYFRESLVLRKKMRDRQGIAETLEGLAFVAVAGGDMTRATHLFGAAHGLREMIGAPLPPVERADYERHVALARERLGEARFDALLVEGRSMAVEQAVADVLEGMPA